MPDAITDTKEKIIMKDHDILIQVTTQLAELIRRFDESIRVEQERNTNFTVEMRSVSLEQVRVSTELKSVEAQMDDLKKHVDDLQRRNTWLDVAGIVGAIIAAVIAWFK